MVLSYLNKRKNSFVFELRTIISKPFYVKFNSKAEKQSSCWSPNRETWVSILLAARP